MQQKYIVILSLLICFLLINIGSAESHIADKNNYYKQHLNINEDIIANNQVTALSTSNFNIAQAQGNGFVLGDSWGNYYINQIIPVTAMYFDEYNGAPMVGANISFHVCDSDTFDLYLYADTDSNGFASVDFIPQVANNYEVEASVVGETGYFDSNYISVEPFVHSSKSYIFHPNTINPVKFTLMDKDLNPINSLIDFQFGDIFDSILPINGTIEYLINSSTTRQNIILDNVNFGSVNPSDYTIEITNKYIHTLSGSNIPYFMRVFNSDNMPLPNTNFTIYIEWYDYETWQVTDTSIFNVTTNNYGLSEFEITVPTGYLQGRFYIIKQSDFNNGPCYGTGCTQGYIWGEEPTSSENNGFDFDLDISDWMSNYNEQITISVQLHNSSKYYSNMPVYLSVDGNSVKLITDSIGEASFAYTPTANYGCHMVYAMVYIPEEGGLWYTYNDVFVTPANPYIYLSLNGNVVDINVNMRDSSNNLISNSSGVLEFVRTPSKYYWNGISDNIFSKYIKPVSGTYTDQITLNKYGKYTGYVDMGRCTWHNSITYTPFEYSTNLDDSFYSGQDNLVYINVKKNGIPLTSGNVYLNGHSQDYDLADFHDIAPIDSSGNAILTISPLPNDEWVYVTIGVSTESETYDLVDDWIDLLPSVTAYNPALVFAITPNSRLAQVDTPVTIFLSVINSGTGNATDVSISQASSLPATISYQTWDGATLTGLPDTPVDIPAGEAAHFVLTINPTAEFTSSPMTFDVSGTNAAAAPISSVNTLTMAASATPYADVIMMSTSLDVSTAANTATAFALATTNVGTASATDVSLVVDIPSTIIGMSYQVNETNLDGSIKGPATGLTIPVGGCPTFAVFLTPTQAIDYDPANNRIVLKLVDGSGKVVGAQSVSVSTT